MSCKYTVHLIHFLIQIFCWAGMSGPELQLVAYMRLSFFFLFLHQMSDDNPFVIPEMEPTLRKQIQECNWQVVNVTTPANYFHVLRRQVSLPRCTFLFF